MREMSMVQIPHALGLTYEGPLVLLEFPQIPERLPASPHLLPHCSNFPQTKWKEFGSGNSEHLLSLLPPHPNAPQLYAQGRVLTWIKSSSREALKVQSSRRASFRSRSSKLPRAQCSSTRALIPGAVKKPRQVATLSCRSSRICWGSEHLSSPQGSLGGWTRCSQHLDLQ